MSTELQTNLENVTLTQYSAGQGNVNLQVTQSGLAMTSANPLGLGYVQLNSEQALVLAQELLTWVNGCSEPVA